MKTYNKIVIGIDQSYSDTGISIIGDKKILKYGNWNFKGLKNNSEKRNYIRKQLPKILIRAKELSDNVIIITEKIRTFSGGFLSSNYLISTGALVAVITDIGYNHQIKTYSVDTRAWKSKIVGTSKHKTKDKKLETINFILNTLEINLPFKVNKSGKIIYNDNIADAICIGLYGFIPESLQKLKELK